MARGMLTLCSDTAAIDSTEEKPMTDLKKLKSQLQSELDVLRSAREQLDLQLTLARAESRNTCAELERELTLAQEEIDRIDEHSQHAFRDVEQIARARLDRIKHGLGR